MYGLDSNGVPKTTLTGNVDIVLIRHDDSICMLPFDVGRRRIAACMGSWSLTKGMGILYCTYRSPFPRRRAIPPFCTVVHC